MLKKIAAALRSLFAEAATTITEEEATVILESITIV